MAHFKNVLIAHYHILHKLTIVAKLWFLVFQQSDIVVNACFNIQPS